MMVRSIPSSSLPSVSSSAPSRATPSGKSAVNLGFNTECDSMDLLHIADLNRFMSVRDASWNLLNYLSPASFLETLKQHLRRTVTSRLLFRQELECVDQVLWHTP